MAMVYSAATSTLARASLSSPVAGAAVSRNEQQQQQQDEAEPRLPPPRRAPRRRWQWSKGDGPGEYGGPPLDFRVRKIWGEAIPDPITTSDGYIWNKDWQSHLPSLVDENASPNPVPASQKEPEVGFLSLNRSLALDRVEVDLTKELVTPPKSILALQVEALREGQHTDEAIRQDKPRWRMAPTRREQKQRERARKPGGMAILVTEREDSLNPVGSKEAVIAKRDYSKLKGDLQILTAIFGGAGLAVSYASYSSEVALSYGVGLLGALAYIRMLGSSVDSLGQTNSQGAMRAALGQPRLLVPVVLVMFFNRWNDGLCKVSCRFTEGDSCVLGDLRHVIAGFAASFVFSTAMISCNLLAADSAWALDPAIVQTVFQRSCVGCHVGGGNIIQPGATLTASDLQRNGVSAIDDIYKIIYSGKGRMPGFGEQCAPRGQCTFGPRLSDEEIRSLAEFVRLQADQGWKSSP